MSRGSWIITPSGVIIYKCASPTCQTPGAPPRRYKLRTPAPAYFGTHAATMQRVELCAAAAGAWRRAAQGHARQGGRTGGRRPGRGRG